jgi:sugar lactone lactonase YvrE
VAVDRAGNVYIADSGNNIIRKVSNGVITTFAGNGLWGYSGENGPATSASLAGPSGVAVDAAGNVYIADTFNNVVRKVSNGLITTFAGNRLGGYLGDNGPATRAELSYPYGVAVDASGSVYIADSLNDVIRKVLNGVITTFAGNGTYGYSGDNGPATDAMLRQPYGVAADASGNVYIADSGNQLIRKVTNGVITTILQGGLIHPCGVAVDASGNVYATDLYMIWKVSNGAATMIAGNETPGYSGDDGPATNAEFNQPFGVAVDAAGDVYIADTFNYVTRVLVSPIAAQAVSLSAETCSGSLPVNIPAGVAWTASSNDSWITITGGASGTGSGAVSFTVQPNTGAARTGSITIAGQTFTIEQQSASATGLSFAGSLAQIASAGGWDTVLTLVNLGTTAGEARLNLFAADGTTPWLPYTFPQAPSQGTVLGSTFDETLNAGAMLVMDTAGPAGQAVIAGSAQLQARGNVNGFGIFEIRSTGQQSVVPLETRNASSHLLAFDETNGLNTGLALANVSPVAGNVNVVVRDDTGAVIPTKVSSIPLDGSGHTSFMLNDPTEGFPEIEGKRGTVEFDTPTGGQISVLGLRANGKAITTLPVLAQVGTTGGAFAHVASGGGWETSFTLVNTGSSAAPFTLHFYDATTGLALPLTFGLPQNGPATQSASSITQTLAPGATLVIQTQGGSATFACSAELTTTGPISGFAIFRVQESGQEAVVPLETRAPNAFVLAYDNTKSVATGVALANVSAQAATVPVIVRDDTGATIANGQIALAANGHTSFLLTDTALGFPSTAGKRGTIEFDKPAGGRISVLGIRAVTNVITTIPVMAVQ